jgi:transposase
MDAKLPATVEECHQSIRLLLNKLDGISIRLDTLETENKKLKLENAELKDRLNNNSSNSSLPPSKSLKKKKSSRQSSGKASGGQKGHKGHYRELLPSAQADFVENCPLKKYCPCGGSIKPGNDYVRHQVHELPVLKLHVTEYQLQKGCCEQCRQKHVADLPEGITWGITGSRLTSFMSDLVARFGLSRREQKLFLEDHFQFRMSLGTIFNKQKIVTAAMETPVKELLPIIKESGSVHSDETGHNRDGKNHWMWGFISSSAAHFSIHASRGKKVLKAMMGDFKNIVVSDRYAAYNIFDSSQRQICWAHLKRDFTKLSEKEDEIISRIGKNLLACESDLFKVWHEFKAEKILRHELLRRSQSIRQRTGELLEQGSYTDPKLRTVRFCKNLLENFNALWTFLECDQVEPTNNHAERSLRPLVIWRKKYFFTRSDYGTEYVARSASLNMTCKLQKKSYFGFLCTLLQNHFAGRNTSALSLMT